MTKIPNPILYLRSDKVKKNGKKPLYIRFQRINGWEPKFPLGIDLAENEWDVVTKRLFDTVLKVYIDNEIARIETKLRIAVINNLEITKSLLSDIVSNKDVVNPRTHSFYDYFYRYIENNLKHNRFSDSTYRGYLCTLNSLKEFRKVILVRDITAKLLHDFEKFLKSRGVKSGKGEVKGSRFNRMRHIRAVIRYIDRQGVKIENPYAKGELIIPKVDENNVFLDFDELTKMCKLINKVKEGSTEWHVLLMYLFSCANGLRIGDVLALKWANIDVDRNPMVLNIVAIKNKRALSVPIFSLAEEVLQYAPEGNIENIEPDKNIFHTYSQTLINRTLRKLAKKAGIKKYITFHSSRRTFATHAKMEGVDDYTLKNYMGHASARTTERYGKWSASLAECSARKIELFKIKELLK